MCLVAYWIGHDEIQRITGKTVKIQTIFIIILVYLMLYFSSGLLIGYGKSIYSHTVIGLFKNIWAYVFIIFLEEYIRNVLVKSSIGSKFFLFSIAILFALYEINLYNVINIRYDYAELFKYISSIGVPALASSLLFTYLSNVGGYLCPIVYRVPIMFTSILLPILPSMNWYYQAIIGTLLPFIVYIFIRNIHIKKTVKESKNRIKKYNPVRYLPILFVISMFVIFMAGFFKYKPVAIMSNSMSPVFNRGDVVVIEKLNEEELKNLQLYDIIEYIVDDTVVVHRIIAIDRLNNGSVYYQTKGDNNNAADAKKVKPEQILGIVKFSIAKVGYPSVWLNDFFYKNKANIETSK